MPIAAKIASSSVGGSRRTRRVPYLVFQSSLMGAPRMMWEYLGLRMLHCNMKLMWQYSHAFVNSKAFQPCGVINLECWAGGGERLQRADEIARGRHREMRHQRGPIRPLLDKHQPERILAIDMHRVRDAAIFCARAMHMLQAQSADLAEGILTRRHASGHHDHPVLPTVMIAGLSWN